MSKKPKMSMKALGEKLLEDWPIKIICLVFAFIIFLFYRRSTLGRRYFSTTLTVENTNELVVASNYPHTVKVTLWGDNMNIASIRENDVQLYVDLTPYSMPGNYKVPIKTKLTGSALSVTPLDVSVEPRQIELKLEESATKRVPVYLSLKGTSAKSFEIVSHTVDPASVEIKGPASMVAKIESLSTEAVMVENRTTSFSGKAALINNNSLITIVGTGRVDYWVKIAEKIVSKDFTNMQLSVTNLSPELKVTSSLATVLVTLSGKENILTAFVPAENFITIDCSDITEPGDYNLGVIVNVPDGLTVSTVFPNAIDISVAENEEPVLPENTEALQPDLKENGTTRK